MLGTIISFVPRPTISGGTESFQGSALLTGLCGPAHVLNKFSKAEKLLSGRQPGLAQCASVRRQNFLGHLGPQVPQAFC